MTQLDTLKHNQAAAGTFVVRLSKLSRQWYRQLEIEIGDVEGEPYASTRKQVDTLRTVAGPAASTQMGAFIVASEAEIGRIGLPRLVDVLAQAVVSAFLVRNLDGSDRALRTLYRPFEKFIPFP